jgi:hypothetical protein
MRNKQDDNKFTGLKIGAPLRHSIRWVVHIGRAKIVDAVSVKVAAIKALPMIPAMIALPNSKLRCRSVSANKSIIFFNGPLSPS